MWKFNTTNLPSTSIFNTDNLIALELFELETIKSPLFTSNVVASIDSSSSFDQVIEGQVPIVDTETELVPTNSSFLYVIEGELNINGLTYVTGVNLLNAETYTFFNGFTYLITDEATLDTTQVLNLSVPSLDSTYSFTIEVGSFDSIDKVLSRGLTLNFVEDSGILIVSSSPTCHPTEGEDLLVYVSHEISLTNYDKRVVHIFDLPSTVTYVLELSYLGKTYYLKADELFQEGTLINNYTERKVLIF
jgi:hypothetical protein